MAYRNNDSDNRGSSRRTGDARTGGSARRPSSQNSRAGYSRDRREVSSSKSRAAAKRSSNSAEEGLMLDDNFEIITAPKNSKKKKSSKGRTVLKVLLSIFLVGVITVCVVVGTFLVYIFKFIDPTIDQNLNNLKLEYTSIIYAEDGKDDKGNAKYVELKRLHGSENRLWIDLDQMPEALGDAFISAEDKRFKSHTGVDWKRTASAVLNEIFHFTSKQGGSTITQQLVKNITGDSETVYTRKIREIMRAQYLESMYSKDVILECYLNTIALGNGTNGVEVASCYYFDKHAKDLTLTQCAALAAITKSPSDYDPYDHPDTNKNRRNWILDEMYNNGYITKEECEAAKEADLGLRKTPSSVLSSTDTIDEGVNSYFVDAVIEDVIHGLMKQKNYSYEYAEAQIYKGGYKIYATIDLDVQKQLDKAFADKDNFVKIYNDVDPQSAITVMDYEGHIVGIVGGRGEKKSDRTLNRATQSPRQTGSAIKPITAYAPGIEYNKITWASKMKDEAVATVDGKRWPVNYTGYYSGTVSILYALQQSLNTIPVKLVQNLGIDATYKFATEKMGITTLYSGQTINGSVSDDRNLSSLALGGSSWGVTTTEVTAAYCTFGNGGIYYTPHTYTQVLDQYDEVVIDVKSDNHRAISEETAYVMCKMLQTVTTKGTGTQARIGDWPIMSKTGTTTGTKDRWFVGCTPYYAAAVWYGTDENQDMRLVSNYINPALKVWRACMSGIMEGKKLKDFPDCDSVVYCKYCTSSGKVARTGCSDTAYGYFKSSYMPLCDTHSGEQVEAADKPARVGEKTTSKYAYDEDDGNNDNDNSKNTVTAASTKKTNPNKTDKTAAPTAAPTKAPTAAPTKAPATATPATEPPAPATEPPATAAAE